MLMVTVKEGDYVMLNEDIKIKFMRKDKMFQLAIDAPRDVVVTRSSYFEKNNQIRGKEAAAEARV